jgi:uncharacterized protein with HEPN domain
LLPPGREWRLRVEDILEAIAKIERYVTGLNFEQFRADQKTVDAVVRNLEVIGEAVRHLSTDEESLPAGVPWTDIADMGNILIHEYFGVDWQFCSHVCEEVFRRFLWEQNGCPTTLPSRSVPNSKPVLFPIQQKRGYALFRRWRFRFGAAAGFRVRAMYDRRTAFIRVW